MCPSSEIRSSDTPSCVLFVGINGAGKTTTVGKIASAMAARGKNVVIGSADTFRAPPSSSFDGASALASPSSRDRGSDLGKCLLRRARRGRQARQRLVLIDTAGRLHTSPELMRELAKVVNVTRKRAANMAAGPMPVFGRACDRRRDGPKRFEPVRSSLTRRWALTVLS